MSKRKVKGDGIRLVMIDGPVQCHTPIVRSDLERGCETFTLPYLWGSVTYRLSHVTDGVHVYQEERHDEAQDDGSDVEDEGSP